MARNTQYNGVPINSQTTGQTKDWTVMVGRTSISLGVGDSISTVRVVGVYSNFYLRLASNAASGASTLSFVQNGAAVTTQTITALTTGEFEDLTNFVTVAAGDLIRGRIVNGGGGTTTMVACGQVFTPTTLTSAFYGGFNCAAVGVSPVNFHPFAGNVSVATTESALVQLKLRVAGTLKNGNCGITSNARIDNTLYRSRLNGADGGILVTATASTTGQFEDLTGSDTVAVGDLVNRSVTGGVNTGTCTGLFGMVLETVDGSLVSFLGAATITTSATYPASSTNYESFNGASVVSATELPTQTKMGMACTVSLAEVYVNGNTVVGNSTLTLRKNGANATIAITITGLTTGWFEDLVNSDTFVGADEIGWQMVAGAAGTSLTVLMISSKVQYAAGAGPLIDGGPLLNGGALVRGRIAA